MQRGRREGAAADMKAADARRDSQGSPQSNRVTAAAAAAGAQQEKRQEQQPPPQQQQQLQRAPMLGAEGMELVQNALSSHRPKDALKIIHERTSLPACHAPALGLLEHLGVGRPETHAALLGAARLLLLERVKTLSSDKLLDLLGSSFKYLGIPDLRPIALAVLERLRPVPTQYLKQLASDAEMFESLPVSVRQQVWELDKALLRRHVQPLLKQFAKERRMDASAVEPAPLEPAATAKAAAEGGGADGGACGICGGDTAAMLAPRDRKAERASSAALQGLVEIIGSSRSIYDAVMSQCRSSYAEKGGSADCSLRSQLLMSLHDAGGEDLCAHDRVHKLAWLLDACAKKGHIDTKSITDLSEFFQEVRPRGGPNAQRNLDDRASNTNDQSAAILGDAGMVIREPYTYNLLLSALARYIHMCASSMKMPKSSETVKFLLHSISLAGSCRKMLRNNKFDDKPVVEATSDALHKTLPKLVEVLADGMAAEAEGRARALKEGCGGGEAGVQGVAAPGGDAEACEAVAAVFSDDMEEKLCAAGEALARHCSKDSLSRRIVFHMGAHSLAASARSPAHVRLTRCVWRATATLDYSAMAHEAAAAEAMVRAARVLLEQGVLSPAGGAWADLIAFGKQAAGAGASAHVELIKVLTVAGQKGLAPDALSDLLQETVATERAPVRSKKRKAVDGAVDGGPASKKQAAHHAAVLEAYRAACAELPSVTRDRAPVLWAWLDDAAADADADT